MGKVFKQTVGSRAQVMHGTAEKTSGGLKKKDLKRVNGRIVSRKASKAAKKRVLPTGFVNRSKQVKKLNSKGRFTGKRAVLVGNAREWNKENRSPRTRAIDRKKKAKRRLKVNKKDSDIYLNAPGETDFPGTGNL